MKIPNNILLSSLDSKSLKKLQKLINNAPHKLYSNSSTQTSNSKTISDILQKLNLPINKLNQELIQKFIKYQLPLDKDLLLYINSLTNNEQKKLNSIIQSIVLLKRTNLNISTSNIKLLTNFLITKPNIANNLQNIMEEKQISQKSLHKLNSFILKPNNNKFSTQELKTKISNLGLDLEKNLLNNNFKPNSKLKGFLYTLKSSDNPLLNHIINKATYNLTSQKLIMHQNESYDTNFLYLQLPLQINENDLTTGHLTIYNQRKEKDSNHKNNSLKLVLKLETENLGLINVELNFNNQKLMINIKTKSEKVLNRFKEEISTLKSKIIDLGYKIKTINYSILPAEAEPNLDFENDLEEKILNTNSLNFKDILHNIDFTI
ncbi:MULTISPECIES: flagellar hook-length control protein FliK [unclassified Candidatus Frackibacter]|uniref:flagellar hook-length control protein FliK n=1 Tax=unclassified Candidatus Frackibacter TaxID=2648818 RepID=UPI00088F15F7|nr:MULTISPECIES: flagellar hook-length control protein FliK [unclassified Candidatus Frackibacter]SDC61197.1 hook-length control protein FliK [Candidatus Frackibacter sp. WG11]SEM75029.1 hook-length control protein FliK [Candidatus Frackibacter sp. WG12]SFL87216.1 hook-length control protein FliK [Candidatus Frackibacter sp. WG13]